jgi:hypothetical protein
MNDTEVALTLINKLSPAIESMSQTVFEAYYKQAYIDGFIGIVIGIVLIAGACYVTKKLIIAYNYEKEKDGCFDDSEFITVFGGLFVLALLVIGGSFLIDGIQHLANPMYFTIQGIISTLK